VIPPDGNAAFVAAMEDVLEVYHRPHDPDCPVVCLDETSKQLVAETRVPIAAKPGQVARYDYEYERNGTANLFMMFAPLEGWRHVEVTDRHTALDYARVLKDLSDTHFSKASKIVGHAFGVLASGGSLRDGAGQSQHPQAGFTLRSVPP
jgi:DDE superfamily endonuclease